MSKKKLITCFILSLILGIVIGVGATFGISALNGTGTVISLNSQEETVALDEIVSEWYMESMEKEQSAREMYENLENKINEKYDLLSVKDKEIAANFLEYMKVQLLGEGE